MIAQPTDLNGAHRMPASRATYLDEMESIPGWFTSLDGALMCAASDHQRAAGIAGDIVEIGVYHGRSAILFGFLLDAGERFIACDPFDADDGMTDENSRWNRRFYPGLTRASFERNYVHYHGALPVIAAVPSSGLGAVAGPASCRIVHVDGAHDYATVRDDARISRELSAPGGVAVFDDYCKPHLPGTAMAVWEQVTSGALVPLVLTDAKLYGCWSTSEAAALRAHLVERATALPGTRVDEHRLADWSVPRIVPRPAPAAWGPPP
jgi:hypothetical protein